MRTRDPVPSPEPVARAREHVFIRHPHPSCHNNVLFRFLATDDIEDDPASHGALPVRNTETPQRDDERDGNGEGMMRTGVAWDVVLWACSIVTGNRFDCFLSTNRDGERMPRPASGVLAAGTYYLHLPDTSQSALPQLGDAGTTPDLRPAYPVVPNFMNWSPPSELEFKGRCRAWYSGIVNPGMSERGSKPPRLAANMRDGRCSVSAVHEPLEVAHIIPVNQGDWWNYHQFDNHVRGHSIDHETNCFMLSKNVHELWDRTLFSIVPKPTAQPASRATTSSPTVEYAPTLHVWHDDDERHANFHNLQLRHPQGIHPLCLFVRFAMDIFPQVAGFLQAGRTRRLLILQADGSMRTKETDSEECTRLAGRQARPKSMSPSRQANKRKALGDTLTESFDSGISGLLVEGDTEVEDSSGYLDSQFSAEDMATERELEKMEGLPSRKRARVDDDSDFEWDFDGENLGSMRGRPRKSKRLTSTLEFRDHN